MDELLDLFDAYIASFNKHAASVAALQATQAELAAQLQALSDKLGELAEGEEEGEAEEEEAEEASDPEPELPLGATPAVCCDTCAFFASEGQVCHKWGQLPPASVLPIGCHAWIISPAIDMGGIEDLQGAAAEELEKAPAPAPEPSPKRRGKAKAAAPAPEAPKAGKKRRTASLDAVPF